MEQAQPGGMMTGSYLGGSSSHMQDPRKMEYFQQPPPGFNPTHMVSDSNGEGTNEKEGGMEESDFANPGFSQNNYAGL